jgi:hypothetical protein
MTIQRFWVVGGEYADPEFRSLACERATVLGPFDSEIEAKDVWRELARETSSRALTRFSILSETFRPAA